MITQKDLELLSGNKISDKSPRIEEFNHKNGVSFFLLLTYFPVAF